MKDEYLLVYCTVPDEESGAKISRKVVGEKLAACSNLIPSVRSFYFWKDELQEDSELLMILKTTTAQYDQLEETIKKMHSYTVPEIIAVPLERGNKDYLNWVFQNVKKRK